MAKIKLKKTFVFTHEKKGIKRISFKSLRSGDIFYCEEPDGTLDVSCLKDGRIVFLWVALSNPEKTMPYGNWGIRVEPMTEM